MLIDLNHLDRGIGSLADHCTLWERQPGETEGSVARLVETWN